MIRFSKMHENGNDFIILADPRSQLPLDPGRLAELMCARRFSVGADALITLENGGENRFLMDIYRQDGYIADAEGCGVCSAARWLYEHHWVNVNEFIIETLRPDGRRLTQRVSLNLQRGIVTACSVRFEAPRRSLPEPGAAVVTMDSAHLVLAADPGTGAWPDEEDLAQHYPEGTFTDIILVTREENGDLRIRCSAAQGELPSSVCAAAAACVSGLTGPAAAEQTVQTAGGKLIVYADRETGAVTVSCQPVTVFTGELAV